MVWLEFAVLEQISKLYPITASWHCYGMPWHSHHSNMALPWHVAAFPSQHHGTAMACHGIPITASWHCHGMPWHSHHSIMALPWHLRCDDNYVDKEEHEKGEEIAFQKRLQAIKSKARPFTEEENQRMEDWVKMILKQHWDSKQPSNGPVAATRADCALESCLQTCPSSSACAPLEVPSLPLPPMSDEMQKCIEREKFVNDVATATLRNLRDMPGFQFLKEGKITL